MTRADHNARIHWTLAHNRWCRFCVPAALLLTLLLMTAPVAAQTVISGCGVGWGPGPLPASGQPLDFVGTVLLIDSVLGADMAGNEFTLRIAGLRSTGPVDVGGGFYQISFVGGAFEIRRDPNRNASFGQNPPNATVPSTFTDGDMYLNGSCSSCVFFYDTNLGVGAWEASLHLQGGEALSLFQSFQALGWTLGGFFATSSTNAPPGYWLASSFELQHQLHSARPATASPAGEACWQPVHVSTRTWTVIKRLYRE